MARNKPTTGHFKNGLPYARLGSGERQVVVFTGLGHENAPPSGLDMWFFTRAFGRIAERFTVHYVTRKPGLPQGYSIGDMANDYATMIGDELSGPVDVMGISTGGPIAQQLAAEHPELVRRLVLAMTAYRLGDEGRVEQERFGELAREGRWRQAYALLARLIFARGWRKYVFSALFWLMPSVPKDPSDMVVTLEAEDVFDFKSRLSEIKAPTLVIGGVEDRCYPGELQRETAAGIRNAKSILYDGVGHNAMFNRGRQFEQDVLAFLTAD